MADVTGNSTHNEGAKNTANNSNVGQMGDGGTATETTFGDSTPPGARDEASSSPTKQSEKERNVKASAKNTANNSNVGQMGDGGTATGTTFGVSTPPGARDETSPSLTQQSETEQNVGESDEGSEMWTLENLR